jgi:SWIM zinc finger
VLALAPDVASAAAARKVAAPALWMGTGCAGGLVWGQCVGSGGAPYITVVEPSAAAYRCSCPSRKLPCKHALALLLLWSNGDVPDADDLADYAASWQRSRAERAGATATRARGERDEQAAARRAELRRERVTAGLAELELWLGDQVRSGLSTMSGTYWHAEPVAARMVDAQAPGIAATLRRLSAVPASGEGWPERLLAGYARLHLLARAHAQLDTLPPDFAATVRGYVGYSVSRERVLTEPAVRDRWLVVGVRDIADAAVPARRSYLRGEQTGRWAVVLAFDPQGQFGGNPDAAFVAGTTLDADLHFYPGRPPLRVAVGVRHGEPAAGASPHARVDLVEQFDEWAAVLALDPWLPEWPTVLRGVPVPGEPSWWFADESGASVSLLVGGIDPWVLAAVSGGAPVAAAGEWSADGFRPLTVWDGQTAVPL